MHFHEGSIDLLWNELLLQIIKEKEKVKEAKGKAKQKIEILSEEKLSEQQADGPNEVIIGTGEKSHLRNKNERISSNASIFNESDINVGENKNGQQKLETSSPSQKGQDIRTDIDKIAAEQSELDLAFKELCDTLIPVRGHGLIRLSHLVQKRDPEVQKRHLAVLKIFEENLDHGDSYIYLSAVNGLAAMCDLYPGLVVPMVCKRFADFHDVKASGDKKQSAELRMKLGEVMMKASRCLGM